MLNCFKLFKNRPVGIAKIPSVEKHILLVSLLWLVGSGSLLAQALTSQSNPPVTIITPRVVFSNPSQPARVKDPLNSNPGPEALAWDSLSKELNPTQGATDATVIYSVTNISTSDVLIKAVRPSCGCTVAKLPKSPWVLSPNESGKLEATIDLRGKRGTLHKYLAVDTSSGLKMLTFSVNVADPPTTATADMRTRNLMSAMADRQAVFKGDCARCHVQPTAGKRGESLFRTACAICHESLHRATMVPDLAATKASKDRDYWRSWITRGKPGTLMPAFAYSEGGILSQEQIESLVAYLTSDFANQRRVIVQPPTAVPAPSAVSTVPVPTSSDLPPLPLNQ